MSISELVERVSMVYGVNPEALARSTRSGCIAEARSVICFLAVREMGCSGAKVAGVLRMSRAGVSVAAGKGASSFLSDPDLRRKIGVN